MAKKKGDAGPKGGAPAAVAAPASASKVEEPRAEKPKTKNPKGKSKCGRKPKAEQPKAEIERKEKIAEALDYRRQGFTYRQIADTMGVAASTAYTLVQEGLQAITLEPATAVKKIALDQCDEIMQRLMPILMDDGAQGDIIDGILKVQNQILKLHGITGGVQVNLPGGGSIEGGDEGDSETVIIQRIKATAPVLKPDGPVPPSPVL